MNVLTAKVLNWKEEGFGFLKGESREKNVFFHFRQQKTAIFDGGNFPILVHPYSVDRFPPKVGEELIYEVEHDKNGKLRAVWWCFKKEWGGVLELIAKRPNYRFWSQRGPKKMGRLIPYGYEQPTLLWEGKDIGQLKKMYPHTSYWVCDDELFRRWFQIEREDGWKYTTFDPRILVQGVQEALTAKET